MKRAKKGITILLKTGILVVAAALPQVPTSAAVPSSAQFGPSNPFYAASTLPLQAPPFDKIKDGDYQPAIEAGMAQQQEEVRAIADNPDPPTFENTLVAIGEIGATVQSSEAGFQCGDRGQSESGITEGAGNRGSQTGRAQRCNFPRSQTVPPRGDDLQRTDSLKLDAESLRLVEYYYRGVCPRRGEPLRAGQS